MVSENVKKEFHVGTPLVPSVYKEALPPFINVKLRYAETVQLTTGTLGVMGTTQTWLLNSLYDPNLTGTGHQPYMFDTYAALYGSYRVNSAKVELIWTTPGSAADLLCAYQIAASQGFLTMSGLSIDRVTELNNTGTVVLTSSGNQRSAKTVLYVNIPNVMAVSRQKHRDVPDYSAAVGASPVSTVGLQCDVGSYSGAAGESCICQAVITYYATFFDRKYQAQS